MGTEQTTVFARPFGALKNGQAVTKYTLRRGALELSVLDKGCTLHSLRVPDRTGRAVDVLLGCLDMENTLADTAYIGQTIGRVANRTENSRFTLNDKVYHLAANEGENHLHGVWEQRVFSAVPCTDGLEFCYSSPDGEEGFPGKVDFALRITLPDAQTVRLDYCATPDSETPLNLTNHSYFNLAGEGDIKDHLLWLGAQHFTEIRPDSCLTGAVLPVAGTPLDFGAPRVLGEGLAQPNAQMLLARGYDHNFVLDNKGACDLSASLFCPRSGIRMQLFTTQPALQLYSGNWLWQNPAKGKDGKPFAENQGVALETQHYPCSLSHPEFPTIFQQSGVEFHQTTSLRFDTV